ncbi:hypothetical protein ACI65C_005423 [Semiaphis heraclei]
MLKSKLFSSDTFKSESVTNSLKSWSNGSNNQGEVMNQSNMQEDCLMVVESPTKKIEPSSGLEQLCSIPEVEHIALNKEDYLEEKLLFNYNDNDQANLVNLTPEVLCYVVKLGPG